MKRAFNRSFGARRCVQRMADGGIRLLSNIGQLQPRRNSNDVPAGLATFAAVECLFEPAVADASAPSFAQ